MNTQQAYNEWASTYDSVLNKTRDLELSAAKEVLAAADFTSVLETGCGTGKNTSWISKKAGYVTAVDFSEGMLQVAREKIKESKVHFQQADLTQPWQFDSSSLIICSLVLEHIQNIDFIFQQASKILADDGCFYVCELHPYKQLEGKRARFEKEGTTIELEYFVHHISDFISAASKNNLHCIRLDEWFDDNNRESTPRLVSFLFQKRLSYIV